MNDTAPLAIIGSTRTRRVEGEPPRLYTPRGYGDAGRA